jgi:hypothetical protein
LAETLQGSSETIAMATSEWDEFSNFFYISRGYPIPGLPLYEEIQEALGIYGKWWIERTIRMLKRNLQSKLTLFLIEFLAHPRLWRRLEARDVLFGAVG